MRIPVEVALHGGEPQLPQSEPCEDACRSREWATGWTGIPKDLHGWQTQHWSLPNSMKALSWCTTRRDSNYA